MITLTMSLIPYGQRLYGEHEVVTMTIASVGRYHSYQIFDAQQEKLLFSGAIPKTQSGHQNPLHLLRNILDDVDLASLPENYVKTRFDT